MGIVNGISIVNNLIAGSMSGAQLQTYLATGANLASFVQVVNIRRQLQVLRNTPAAVTAVTASATASATVAANDAALRQWLLYGTSYNWRSFANLAAVLASAPAMAEVAASSSAMSLLTSTATLRAAVLASATALAAVNANDQAVRIWMLAGTGQVYSNFASVAAVAASSTAMTAILATPGGLDAVIASSTALAAIAASTTAMAAVVTTPTALATLVASSTAMTAVGAAPAAKMAIFNSDAALDAVKASPTAMAALRAAAQYSVQTHVSTGTTVAIPGLNAGGSYIMLGFSKASATSANLALVSTRRTGSTQPNTFSAYTTPTASNAQTYDIALPMVSPFSTIAGGATNWYYGMLRCDV